MHGPHANERKTRRGRKAFATAAVTVLGVAAFSIPAAYADDSSSNNNNKPSIKLTAVDTDIVAVSGRNFPANSKITISAVASVGKGSGEVDVNKDGRVLLGFQVPAGYKGKIDVSASQAAASASITVDIPADANSSTATTTTTTQTTGTTVTITKEVVAAEGGPALEALLKKHSEGMTRYNDMTDKIEKASQVDTDKIDKANSSIDATNKKTAELNAAITALNDAIARGGKSGSEVKPLMDKATLLAAEANVLLEKALDDIEAAKDSARGLQNV